MHIHKILDIILSLVNIIHTDTGVLFLSESCFNILPSMRNVFESVFFLDVLQPKFYDFPLHRSYYMSYSSHHIGFSFAVIFIPCRLLNTLTRATLSSTSTQPCSVMMCSCVRVYSHDVAHVLRAQRQQIESGTF
jgi:hypothetical protein